MRVIAWSKLQLLLVTREQAEQLLTSAFQDEATLHNLEGTSASLAI